MRLLETHGCQGGARNGLFECLPPAFTEHVGARLMAHVDGLVAA